MWGTIIILRDPICVYCGLHRANHPHHIFCKKDCPSTRYDLKNGMGLDGGCHKFKAHCNPEMYRHINIKHVGGQEEHDKLTARASMLVTSRDYKLIEISLWQDLKEYGVFKPKDWDSWKEYKKKEYLSEIRRSHD